MSTSDKTALRRSERLKEKHGRTTDNRKATSEVVQVHEEPSQTTPLPGTSKSLVNMQREGKSRTRSRSSKKSKQKSSSIQTSLRAQAEIVINMKKKELEHRFQQEMLDLELSMKLAKIDEEGASLDSGSTSGSSEFIEDGPNIDNWVNGQDPWSRSAHHSKSSITTANKESRPKVVPLVPNLNNEYSSHFANILTRHSMPTDLPSFSGDPIEWPNFIFQFRNTTRLCGFSSEENQSRLEKCLKGSARKIVESLLILPQCTDKIISSLERRFGRPDLIVKSLLEKVRNLPAVKADKLETLINFSDEIKSVIGTIESLDQIDYLRNPLVLQELLSKLPTSLKLNWVEHESRQDDGTPKLSQFSLWLDAKASVACQLELPLTSSLTGTHKTIFKGHKKDITLTTNEPSKRPSKCICCSTVLHDLKDCLKFKKFSNDERWNFVSTNRLCFSCLKSRHNIKQCKRIKVCGINNCSRPHHKLLHKDDNDADSLETQGQQTSCNQQSPPPEVNCHISSDRNVLLKILPIVISQGEKSCSTYALLDDASSVTLIDQDLADQLGLDGPRQRLCLQWTNNQLKRQEDSRLVACSIRAPDQSKKFILRHVRTIRGMSLPTQTIDADSIRGKYPYIHDNITSMVDAKPKVLIGQDNWPLVVTRKLINGPWNGPAVSKTLLGWVIHGNVHRGSSFSSENQYVCHVSQFEKDELDEIHDMIKRQWNIDNAGIENETKTLSKEDVRAKNIIDKTMKRKGNRFETGLLWRNEDVVLPESRTAALKRLMSTERKMDKNESFGKAYCDKMLDLQQKGYIRKLSEEEVLTTSPKLWYLPHFGVVNPKKPKLRIVFDAAAKSHGLSLNDCLLTGPDMYNSLYNILLNFRIKRYAFTADIKEMFLQIQVREEDRCAQRFLWRGMDRDRTPDVYEIGVVFFGATCSPCLAQEVRIQNALEHVHAYENASRAIVQDFYMDDYLGNADTEVEAKKLIKDVIHVNLQGGFTICGWTGNSATLLDEVDMNLKAHGDKRLGEDPQISVERILGIWWNSLKDTFGFQTSFAKISKDVLENRRRPTKRDILKIVMSVFDPIGFLTNFIVQGKILLQDIWRCKIDWDDIISDHLEGKWTSWLADLHTIFCTFSIPRQYFTLDRQTSKIQLHIFADASDRCYASVAYLRIENTNITETAFVTAKARVAPLRPMSIPRLELQAALIASRLGHSLSSNLKLQISKIYFWTDSKTVLHWIRSEAQRFKIFVAHRIGEIQDLTNPCQWNYIPSRINVADEATKSRKIDFSENSTWLYGPAFLKGPIGQWPKEKPDLIKPGSEVDLEIKDYVFVNTLLEELETPDPRRFSKWNRIRRSTAWVLRFIDNLRKRRIAGELDVSELNKADILLFRKVQIECFLTELNLLKESKEIPKSSRLYTFNCVLDKDGLIRLGGRLNNSIHLKDDMKNPVILDPKHRITELIIHYVHEEMCHQGQETVINNLRQRFWILRIRQTVRKVIKSCQKCKNRKVVPETPIMGQLPLCRLEPTIRCFIKTGVDFFGPVNVAVKRSREKRYGAIFTCMTTRAIHLEVAHDLSTNSFIHVFRQFGCLRGFPEEMYSDNGGNFKGADKELSESLRGLDNKEISKFCSLKGTRWLYNCPLAPNMGGVWERLIASVKKVMRDILTSKCPQEYVLRTVFAEAMNILNSRPLTHVSIDSSDAEALTPNHFLIGPSYAALPCAETDEKDLNLCSKWRASQRLTDHFWRRWTQEYLPELVKRGKWHKDTRPVQVGDIAIIVDPNGPRNIWPKGRVIHLHPGKDKKIRIVDLKLANGTTLRRPVSKLCILDVHKTD